MLEIKLLLLIVFAAAGQGMARYSEQRMTHESANAGEPIAAGNRFQQLQAAYDWFHAEQEARQLRLERLHAARAQSQRATRLSEELLNELLEEQKRIDDELKSFEEQLEKLREERQPHRPGQFEPRLNPRFELQPIEFKPLDSPRRKLKVPPPQIDDMPPLGPLAACPGKLPTDSGA